MGRLYDFNGSGARLDHDLCDRLCRRRRAVAAAVGQKRHVVLQSSSFLPPNDGLRLEVKHCPSVGRSVRSLLGFQRA